MSILKVTKKRFDAAYAKADEKIKEVLNELFGMTPRVKPSLDDYKTIKSYNDACEALGIDAAANLKGLTDSHIIALVKLETISKALWGRDFCPVPPKPDTYYYYPWFWLLTKEEYDKLSEEDKKSSGLLAGNADNGTSAGWRYLDTGYRSSRSSARIGFRLCQQTSAKAEYFGKQFLELWAEYLIEQKINRQNV